MEISQGGIRVNKVPKWLWFVGIPLLAIICFVTYWGLEHSAHSTPQKAQALFDSTVGPFETVPFAKGVVLLTPDNHGGFRAWYMTENFWGWHVQGISYAVGGLSSENYNVDCESFTFDGETFVWGSYMTQMKEIIYHHEGKTYTAKVGKSPVWHMTLPFTKSVFQNSEWTMVLPNGTTAPLFK